VFMGGVGIPIRVGEFGGKGGHDLDKSNNDKSGTFLIVQSSLGRVEDPEKAEALLQEERGSK